MILLQNAEKDPDFGSYLNSWILRKIKDGTESTEAPFAVIWQKKLTD